MASHPSVKVLPSIGLAWKCENQGNKLVVVVAAVIVPSHRLSNRMIRGGRVTIPVGVINGWIQLIKGPLISQATGIGVVHDAVKRWIGVRGPIGRWCPDVLQIQTTRSTVGAVTVRDTIHAVVLDKQERTGTRGVIKVLTFIRAGSVIDTLTLSGPIVVQLARHWIVVVVAIFEIARYVCVECNAKALGVWHRQTTRRR
eukprot:scaffold25307_cov168-Amphora_coffeaeformis.AAC.4